MSANGNPIFQRSYFITSSIQKNTAYAFSMQGVWHNPRIQKQKQYIPKYALTVTIVLEEYKLPDLIHNDWFVSNNMLCSRARTTIR